MENFTADGIYIDASLDRVFTALTDPQDALAWLDAAEARIAPAENGEYSAQLENGSSIRGTIREFSPPRQLVIENYFREKENETRGPMRLSFELIPRDNGVWINIRQDGLDAGAGAEGWEDFAREIRRELIQYTLRLKRHIEGI